jgi:hypothetical protein
MDVEGDILPLSKVGSITPKAMRTEWLIESLWQEEACGIIGGQPKCCKSWLGLDMAVSVASGTPCLGKFIIPKKGPSLIFMAEDRIEEVRSRIEGIAISRGLDLSSLDVFLITIPVMRLDVEEDQKRLAATIASIRPRLLLLDPLVRLHRLDENNAREISGLLGYLRELERRFKVSIIVTHHASKRLHARPGQGLRGSSDLHAFGDSNIYLARCKEDIELSVEHRAAPSIEKLSLRLKIEQHSVFLHILGEPQAEPSEISLNQRITNLLEKNTSPITRTQIRETLRVNNHRLGQAINQLVSSNLVTISAQGLQINPGF